MVNSIAAGSGAPPSMSTIDAGRSAPAADPARIRRGNLPAAPTPTRLERIAADLAAKPPVDTARVEALKLGIATGAYGPDPARIADAMIAQESAGLSPTR